MKKKITSILFVTFVVVAFAFGAFASDVIQKIKAELRQDFVVEIDGVEREFKNASGEVVYPILYDGTTYLPIRAIGEIMGKTVYWYEQDKRIELVDKKTSTVTDADVVITNDATVDKKVNDKTKDINKKPDYNNINVDKSVFISEDKAKKLALDKAGLKIEDITFIKVKLDFDDGVYQYEVEFKSGIKEYNVDIKADDGKVLDFEVDLFD